MGILEDFANEQPLNIEELFPVQKKARAVPIATARNQAALSALLEPGENITETYKLLFDDEFVGDGEFAKRKREGILAGYKNSDTRIAMDILSDPSISDPQKKTALEVLQKQEPSLTEIFMTKSAAKGLTSGNAETQKVADTFHNHLNDEIEYRSKAQAVVNGAIAGLSTDVAHIAGGFLEQIIPGAITAQAVGTLRKAQEVLGIKSGPLEKFVSYKSKEKIINHLESLPPEERLQKLKLLTDTITNNSGLILRDKNDLEALTLLQQLGTEGEYGTGSKVMDAVTQVLDAVGVGGIVKGTVGKVTKLFPKTLVKQAPSPLAPLPAVVSANNQTAKGMYQAVLTSQGDELAQAVSGTTKQDLILHTEGTQNFVKDAVEAKVVNPDSIGNAIEELRNITRQGGVQYTTEEVIRAEDETRKAFKGALGPTQWDNYTQVGLDGDAVVVRGFYGNADGGFLRAEDALENARYQFREFEIADDQLKVYQRTPEGDYTAVSLDSVRGKDGDYIVGLDFRQSLKPSELSPVDVKRNWLDSIPFLRSKFWGSASRNLFDANSMLPKHITGGMENAVDASTSLDKYLIRTVDDYATRVKGLPKDQQLSLAQAIKDSNFNRVELSDLQLSGKYGLSLEAIDAMKVWRHGWDVNHWLTNLTHVKDMRNKGFQILEHQNARLFGKPISKNAQLGNVYDPDLDVVRALSQQEVDDLYNNGGYFAKLRSPEEFNGKAASHFVVRNNKDNYLRSLADSDQIVNYIPGYYKVYYNSPRFVVKYGKDANGVQYEQAIAVAGTHKEADLYLRNLARQAGVDVKNFGRVRGDVKQMIPGSDEEWQISKSAGAINQRHRGQLLQDAGSTVHLGQSDFIVDPLESFVRASSSIARKVALQDNIDLAKERLMTQYKHLMPADGSYPNSWQAIGRQGDMFTKETADARTLWDYIQQQEATIYNLLDEGIKVGLRAMSDALGKAGLGGLERAAGKASEIGFTRDINNFLHQILIKWNPLRQWIVQPIQAMQLFAYSPTAAFKTLNTLDELGAIIMKKARNVPLTKAEKELDAFVRDWGGFAGVDRQVMVDGPIRDLHRSSNVLLRAFGRASDGVGKVGFDSAEKFNLLSHLLTVRNKFLIEGKDVTSRRVIDEIRAETRALTLSMNSAGDMPYNKSAASLFVKFLQIPHKGLMKITTNRRLDGFTQLRIGAWEAMLFGVPAYAVAEWMDKNILSDDPKIREIQTFGYLTYAYNALWRNIAGKDPKANLQSMGPYETDGWRKLWSSVMEDGFMKMFANAPAGSLVMGNNPRLTNAFQKMGSWMRINKYQDNPAQFLEVITEFAKLSSGFNNAYNYYYVLNTNKELNKLGVKLRDDVDNWTALHELFGIQTTSEAAAYAATDTAKKSVEAKQKEIEDQVRYVMKLYKDRFQTEIADPESTLRVLNEFNRMFDHDPAGLDMAYKSFLKLSRTSDSWFIDRFLEYAGILPPDKLESLLKRSGAPEDQVQEYMRFLDDLKDVQEQNKLDEYERQAEK